MEAGARLAKLIGLSRRPRAVPVRAPRPSHSLRSNRAGAIRHRRPMPLAAQTATVAGIFVALGLGRRCSPRALAVTDVVPPRAKTLTGGALACLLGAAFIFAGYAHFAFEGAYTAIYLRKARGFRYLPGSAEFHVAWTGGAEALGGLGLLLGGLGDLLGDPLSGGRARPLRQLSASSLFLLMVAVFPANIYQYTHLAPPSRLFTVPLRAVCSLSLSLSLSRYYTPSSCQVHARRDYGRSARAGDGST